MNENINVNKHIPSKNSDGVSGVSSVDFSPIISKDLSTGVDDIVAFIEKELNEGKVSILSKKPIFDFDNADLYEIHNWLLNNQNNLNSIFLFGYFNFFGIETKRNYEKAFKLFNNVSEKNHKLAQCNGNIIATNNLGFCYKNGEGVKKDCNKAFKLFKKSAEKNIQME